MALLAAPKQTETRALTVEPLHQFSIPKEATHLSLAGETLRVVEISRHDRDRAETWEKFIHAVALGYSRYSADRLKREHLSQNGGKSTHLALVNEKGDVLGTLSIQRANGKGTEANEMFGSHADELHASLKKAWTGGYVEVKNLTALEGAIPSDKNTELQTKAIVLNALVLGAAKYIQKAEHFEEGRFGFVQVMAPRVATFVHMAGFSPVHIDIPARPEIAQTLTPYFQYFFHNSVFDKEKPLMPDAMIQLALESMHELSGQNVREFKRRAIHNPMGFEAELVRQFLSHAINHTIDIPEAFWITKELLAAGFTPQVYQADAAEVMRQAEDNLEVQMIPPADFEAVIALAESREQPVSIDSLRTPLYTLLTPSQLAEHVARGAEIIIIPPKSINRANFRSESNRYLKVVLPPATTIHGVSLSRERLLFIRIPDGIRIDTVNREVLQKLLLTHGLLRAIPYVFFSDFDPNMNKHLSIERRIWDYLNSKGTHFERLSNLRLAIAGQGTVGLAALQGLVNHGAGNIRVCEKPDERLDKHNVERIAGSTNHHIGLPKLAFTRELVQEAIPFVNLDIVPKAIETQEDADAFVQDQDIVVSALDSPEAMYLLHVAAKKRNIPLLLVTDVAKGSKVQVFDYREQSTPLFNDQVSSELLAILAQGGADRQSLNRLITELLGSRRTRFGNIPMIDLLTRLPRQSLQFFVNKLRGSLTSLAQDSTSASVTGVILETLIHEFANTGNLPKTDAVVIPEDAVRKDFKPFERLKIIRDLMAALRASRG